MIKKGILIGSDRRPETKQGIEGKLIGSDRKGLGLRLGVGLGLGSYRRSEPDRRSEPNTVLKKVRRSEVGICHFMTYHFW